MVIVYELLRFRWAEALGCACLMLAAPLSSATAAQCLADQPLGSAATGSQFAPGPTDDGRGVVFAGIDLVVLDGGLVSESSVTVTDDIAYGTKPAVLDSGEDTVFISSTGGLAQGYGLDSGSNGRPVLDWSRSVVRPSCTNDEGGPLQVQLRRDSSTAFQARYGHDLVFTGTRFVTSGGSCTGDASRDNQVWALNASDGATEWQLNSGSTDDLDVVSGLGVDPARDTLYVTSDRTFSTLQDSVWALDVLTGSLDWAVSEGRIWVPPVVRDSRLYVANLSGELKALDKGSGNGLWTLPNGGIPIVEALSAGHAAPYDDLIAVVDFLGQVGLVRDDGNAGVWEWSEVGLAPGVQATSVVLDDIGGHVYAGGSDGRVYQIDILTGQIGPTRTVSSSGETFLAIQDVSQGGTSPFSILTAGPDRVARFCAPFASATAVPVLSAGAAVVLTAVLAATGACAARITQRG